MKIYFYVLQTEFGETLLKKKLIKTSLMNNFGQTLFGER